MIPKFPKILVLGCSFSAAGADSPTINSNSVPIFFKDNWTYKLKQLYPCRIYNTAICGIDVFSCNSILREQLDIINPDIVLFEVTYRLRKTYSPIRDNITACITKDIKWTCPEEDYNFYSQLDNDKIVKTSSMFNNTEKNNVNFSFLVGWARHFKFFQTILMDEKQNNPPKNETSIWWNEITKEHSLIDNNFYKNLENKIDNNTLLNIESLAIHKANTVIQTSLLSYYQYLQALESAKYILEKKNIPHLFFTWGSLKNDKATPNSNYDKRLQKDTGVVDFSIYDSIPFIEQYALDSMLHLDNNGHTEVSKVVHRYIQTL